MKYKDIRDILAYAYSIVCYPLFISTYLMVIFCVLYSGTVLPLSPAYYALAIGGTLFFTCLVPLIVLLLLIHSGHVHNLDVTDPRERTVPYIYTLISIGFWCYFLKIIHLPQFMFWSAVASAVVLLLVTFITPYWKISVHLSSMGGAVAMLWAICMHCGVMSNWVIPVALIASWLLMLSRIRLEAHTPLQTVCGFLLGLFVVLTPNIILMHIV